MASKEDLLFGKMALEKKLITREQLDECLKSQKIRPDESLPAIAAAKGFVMPVRIQGILKAVSEKLMSGVAGPGAAKGDGSGKAGALQISGEGLLRGASVKKLQGKGLGEFLRFGKQIGASDIHISAGGLPYVRLHGRIRRLDLPPHSPKEAEKLLLPAMNERQREIFLERNDFDFALQQEGVGRFRTNYFRHRKGISGVFRLIPEKVPSLAELNLPPLLEQFTKIQVGIVLITGPAGCGKSSTMAALVEIINQTRKDHVITVEDPIEYLFESKKSNVTQRQVEVHTETWGIALRAGLREDPDVIMVGEMRDLDTIATAVTAAETGHLVLGTLHTTNATRTVDRIIDIFPPKQQEQIRAMVSESIRGVICQQLIPRADGKGRVPALEILVANPAVGNLIREKRTFQLISVLQTGKNQGMVMMDDSIQKLLDDGVITRDEAIFRAQDPKRFKGKVRVPVEA